MALDFHEVLNVTLPPVSRRRKQPRGNPAGRMAWLSVDQRRQINAMDVQAVMWEVGDGTTVTPEQRRNGARWLVMWMLHHPDAKKTRDAFMHAYSGQDLDGENVIDLMIEICEHNVKTGVTVRPPGLE